MTTNLSDLIYSSRFFTVERHPQPFISREEGGHLRIFPKRDGITCLNDLTPAEAVELIWLETIVRQALLTGMEKQGVPMIWVNIEDLGNWAFKRHETPQLHIHMFGRASTATKQLWPEAPSLPDRSSGFYDSFVPINEADMAAIKAEIELLLAQPPFNQPELWRL
jgi:diadenosine tetraphosphate (Ap4A) HIT family hydrolase